MARLAAFAIPKPAVAVLQRACGRPQVPVAVVGVSSTRIDGFGTPAKPERCVLRVAAHRFVAVRLCHAPGSRYRRTDGRRAPDPKLYDISLSVLRAAHELAGTLRMDEVSFTRISHLAHANARNFAVYGALREVGKAAITAIWHADREAEDNADSAAAAQDDFINALWVEASTDQDALVQRKLLEQLADLICFAATNDEPCYRDYLLHHELSRLLGTQDDLRRSYGCESLNVADQIADVVARIRRLEHDDEIDPARAWYRKRGGPLVADDKLRPGQVLASFGTRLRTALRSAAPQERIALGLSYDRGFGMASRVVHASPGDSMSRPDRVDAIALVTGWSVLHRCQQLVGGIAGPHNEQVARIMSETDAPRLIRQLMAPHAKVGDVVWIAGELGEVLDTRVGDVGYVSYKIKYLTKPFLPSIPVDWHIGQEVRVIVTREQALDGLARAELPEGTPPLDPDAFYEDYKAGMVELWHRGLRDAVIEHNRPEVPQESEADSGNL